MSEKNYRELLFSEIDKIWLSSIENYKEINFEECKNFLEESEENNCFVFVLVFVNGNITTEIHWLHNTDINNLGFDVEQRFSDFMDNIDSFEEIQKIKEFSSTIGTLDLTEEQAKEIYLNYQKYIQETQIDSIDVSNKPYKVLRVNALSVGKFQLENYQLFMNKPYIEKLGYTNNKKDFFQGIVWIYYGITSNNVAKAQEVRKGLSLILNKTNIMNEEVDFLPKNLKDLNKLKL